MTRIVHVPGPLQEAMPEYAIPPQWIIEGRPDSRGQVLIESADKQLGCGQWRCTPGKFRWEYTFDEFIWLREGEVRISVEGQPTITLRAGDTAHFPIGTVAVWEVVRTVHKVFFVRNG